jgi:hypothetical protein
VIFHLSVQDTVEGLRINESVLCVKTSSGSLDS